MARLIPQMAALWALLGGLLVLSIIAVTTLNVLAFGLDQLARGVGASVPGLPGYEDYVRLAVSAAVLMFFPYCQLQRGHVSVDLFVRFFPAPIQKLLDITALLGIATVALFLAYWMWQGLLETRADGALSRVLGWPEWPFYLPGVVSLLLWAAVAGQQLLERWRRPAAGADVHG